MDIKKCDLCKKEIKERKNSVYVRFASFESADLCEDCASPIYKFIKKNKLSGEPKKEIKKA